MGAMIEDASDAERRSPLDLFDFAESGVRRSDPDTSWAASFRDLARKKTDRVEALAIHYSKPHGLTDYELADLMDRQFNSAGKRRGELRDLGLIMDTGQRRPGPSGSLCIVWAITEAGCRMHLELLEFGKIKDPA